MKQIDKEKEILGLKRHLDKEKTRTRIYNKFLFKPLYYEIEALKTQLNILSARQEWAKDDKERATLHGWIISIKREISHLNEIMRLFEEAYKCVK